ncbi:MAG: alpha/beta hydrolase [Thermoleophilaceae bacterium]
MTRADLTFDSGGERCAAWHWAGEDGDFAGERGRPCVVMAHGFGYTRDSGLEPYAERFAAAGLDVLLFDYRSFGDSTGEPRQLVDWRRHREDYRAAVDFARTLGGVDPDRVALWGSSYAGGHVICVAADDGRVAAVVSQVPAMDGLAAVLEIGRYAGPLALLRTTAVGARDAVGALLGRRPLLMPIVGPPGSVAALTSPDAQPGSQAIEGPSFRNEFCARAVLGAALNRPVKHAGDVPCPTLFQVADRDTVAPPGAVMKAAWKATGRAEVRRYPIGHFDVYTGDPFERAVADQLHFLRRHLALSGGRTGARATTAARGG